MSGLLFSADTPSINDHLKEYDFWYDIEIRSLKYWCTGIYGERDPIEYKVNQKYSAYAAMLQGD